jgi:hypothetical protein
MRDPNIDRYLHEMAMLFQNLGTESSLEERIYAKEEERRYIRKIYDLDPEMGKRLGYD